MLVWLNGAHGAGKTSVARAIAERRPGCWLLDPEQIGFILRKAWPAPMPDDFKELPVWRQLTLTMLRVAAAERPDELILVPMTLAEPEHFREIVGALGQTGVSLRHFTLAAEPATLRRRLRRRLDWPGSRNWALARVDSVSRALSDEIFATHVATDQLTIEEVAEMVLALLDRE